MRIIVAMLASMILTPVVAWFAVAIPCSIPGVGTSNACGHNAYIWLIVVGPVVYVALAAGIYRIIREKKGSANTHAQDA